MSTEASWPRLQLKGFEGPLSLLLFFVKKREVDVHDVFITEIIEQYLTHLRCLSSLDLEEATEFQLMIATLLDIKARWLLPTETAFDEEWQEEPRQELTDKLIDYQKYKTLSSLMSERMEEVEWLVERKEGQPTLPFVEQETSWAELSVWSLVQSFSKIVGQIPSERLIDLYEKVSINEKVTLIRELSGQRREFLFSDLIFDSTSIAEIVCTFMAILELTRSGEVAVLQSHFWGEIKIRCRENS